MGIELKIVNDDSFFPRGDYFARCDICGEVISSSPGGNITFPHDGGELVLECIGCGRGSRDDCWKNIKDTPFNFLLKG